MISYQKAFNLMAAKNLTTYVIRRDNVISQGALTSMRNNKSVSIDTIEKLCVALNCQLGDLMEYIPDKKFDND